MHASKCLSGRNAPRANHHHQTPTNCPTMSVTVNGAEDQSMDERRQEQDFGNAELKRCAGCGRRYLLQRGYDHERVPRRRDWRLEKEFHSTILGSTRQPDSIEGAPSDCGDWTLDAESAPRSGRCLTQKAGESWRFWQEAHRPASRFR